MNIISFSLYGSVLKYSYGLSRNIELAQKHYPGWRIYVFCDFENFVKFTGWANPKSGEYSSGEVTFTFGQYNWCPPMMQRFLVADFQNCERFIVRDTDSRVGPEEAAAVQEWIQEDTILHTCRAHPAHCRPINGGLWGGRWRRPNWSAPSMENMIREYLDTHDQRKSEEYGTDQDFLGRMIWPWARISATQHASVCREAYPGSKPFPVKWQWPRFMGEVWNVSDDLKETPRDGDWESAPKE